MKQKTHFRVPIRFLRSRLPCSLTLLAIFLVLAIISPSHADRLSSTATPASSRDVTLWNTKQIQEHVTWKHRQFENLYGSPQFVSLVTVDLSSGSIRLAFPFATTSPLPVSTLSKQAGAIAGINGTFFSLETKKPTRYFKVNGFVIHEPKTSSAFFDGALTVSNENKVAIRSMPKNGWNSLSDCPQVLGAGPMLLLNGDLSPFMKTQKESTAELKRHPRSAIGMTKDSHLILVAVDGRNEKAHGMTLPELADLMKTLGCTSALNLDGGGSTTLYVRGEPDNGIVNHPCDNVSFDHFGERDVINAIIIRENPEIKPGH